MAKDPRVKAIEEEAHRRSLADGKTSHKERFAIRRELRQEAGLGKEKKKRGGAAGVWDRSKDVIVPLGAAALGLATGGLAAPIAASAFARGVDREGKGGIGFDAGQAVRGGLEGAMAGSVGRFAGGLLNPAAAPIPMGGGIGAAETAPWSLPVDAAAQNAATNAPWSVAGSAAPVPLGGVRGIASKGLDFLKGNGGRNALGILQGINAASQSAQSRALANRAVRGQEAEWQAGQPLRMAGRETLLNGVAGNPFAPVRVR